MNTVDYGSVGVSGMLGGATLYNPPPTQAPPWLMHPPTPPWELSELPYFHIDRVNNGYILHCRQGRSHDTWYCADFKEVGERVTAELVRISIAPETSTK